jgi:hypothetical protein
MVSDEVFISGTTLHRPIDAVSYKARRLALLYSTDIRSIIPCYSLIPRNDYIVNEMDVQLYVMYASSGVPFTKETEAHYDNFNSDTQRKNNSMYHINARNKLYATKLSEFTTQVRKAEKTMNTKFTEARIKKDMAAFIKNYPINVYQFTKLYNEFNAIIDSKKKTPDSIKNYLKNIIIYDMPTVDMDILNKDLLDKINTLAGKLGYDYDYTFDDYINNSSVVV